MILVNIGCGEVHHPAWINLDVAPSAPGVRRWDARRPLPFATGTVDGVYHAHLLEHLSADEAPAFLGECRRVLRAGGVMRVVVPDLEGIAQAYLRGLAEARGGAEPTRWEWTRLELTDQLARETSGGEMASYARRLTAGQIARVRERAGAEIDGMLKHTGARRRHVTFGKIARRAHREIARALLLLLGGRPMRRMFDVGWFRQSGEVHRVMYDALSLARLLGAGGFVDPQRVSATESRIPGFAAYGLDAVDGRVRKPDSLFMEALRP